MPNTEKLTKAMELLGPLTDEQKALVQAAIGNEISEKELFEKLDVDEETFSAFLNAVSEAEEDAILAQELSESEMENSVGGVTNCPKQYEKDRFLQNECKISATERWIYRKKFPNCAATVGDGSWCGSNDACYTSSIRYTGMKSCSKAWK